MTDEQIDAIEARVEVAHVDAREAMIPDERYDAGLTIPEARAVIAEVRRLRAALDAAAARATAAVEES